MTTLSRAGLDDPAAEFAADVVQSPADPRPLSAGAGSATALPAAPATVPAPPRRWTPSRDGVRGLRGRTGEAAWIRPAALGVLALAAVLYLVNLSVSGYANTYYSMAAQAGAQSWSAWFFGALDPAGFITVDKPPLATMLMGLSVRVLGLSSFSILLPEALCGVATVGVTMLVVRRTFGPVAAVLAGLVTAITPAAVLMFRYDNPDALLTLLLVLAAWALVRAIEHDRLRWVVVSALLVGLAFNTKFLQAWLVLPAFALVWAVAAPGDVRRRIAGLALAAGTVLASSFAWVVAIELIPASARPYIGGSTTNSALELLLGYDGLGRIFGSGGPGSGGGGGGPGGGAGGFGGTPGLFRLFNDQFAGEIAWLLPFAAVGLGGGLWIRRRTPRTDLVRAGFLLWGGWLLTHVVVFSFMSGIVHPYYAVAMAPAIGALVGGGAVGLWKLRSTGRLGGLPLAIAITSTAILAFALLARTPAFAPGLGLAVLGVGLVAAAVVAVPRAVAGRTVGLVATALALAVLLAGPAAYAFDTVGTALAGGDPSSGPGTGGFGGPGGPFGFDSRGTLGGGPGGPGGPGGGATSTALLDYLVANRGDATWIVAANGSGQAASIQLETGLPVMAMGGFSGGDPAPTLDQLEALVASGELRFVLAGGDRGFGGPGGFGGRGSASGVSAWVTSACAPVSIDGATGQLYDCAGAVADTTADS